MPGYRTHLFVALLIYACIAWCVWGTSFSWQVRLLGLFAICAGALFPDIDIKSKGQQYLYLFYACALSIVILLYVYHRTQFWIDLIIMLAVIAIAPMLARHRGITHSPRFILLIGMIGWIVIAGLHPHETGSLFFYSCCFICGALSHVWLDKRRIFFLK